MGNFSHLPAEIMFEIFSRLPTESVLESKLVCKTWRNVVRHRSFAQMHSNILLSHSSADCGKLTFILRMKEFHYLEYDNEVSSVRVKRMNFNPPFQRYSFLGSCNGLICLKVLPNHYTNGEWSTASYVPYICNPITREVVTLPELDRSKYYHLVKKMLFGFGYVASTKEYKVVRMCTFERDFKVAQIDVYTLGSGKGWRNAGMLHNYQGFIIVQNAMFVNGFLYWNFGNRRTAVYDLADEIFVGDSVFLYGHLSYRVLGDHLYGINYIEYGGSTCIWLLKKKEDESIAWCEEFRLSSTDLYNTPFAFTSNGTVLGYSDTKLNLYDLKSTSSEVLEDFGRTIYDVIPHMNTLVSLKAFGEENTTTLE